MLEHRNHHQWRRDAAARFLYVEDVRANVLALDSGQGIYNLGTGVPTDINTIFRELAKLTEYEQPERHGPASKARRAVYLDADAGRERLEAGRLAVRRPLPHCRFLRARAGQVGAPLACIRALRCAI
jgi:hypothetical protein